MELLSSSIIVSAGPITMLSSIVDCRNDCSRSPMPPTNVVAVIVPLFWWILCALPDKLTPLFPICRQRRGPYFIVNLLLRFLDIINDMDDMLYWTYSALLLLNQWRDTIRKPLWRWGWSFISITSHTAHFLCSNDQLALNCLHCPSGCP